MSFSQIANQRRVVWAVPTTAVVKNRRVTEKAHVVVVVETGVGVLSPPFGHTFDLVEQLILKLPADVQMIQSAASAWPSGFGGTDDPSHWQWEVRDAHAEPRKIGTSQPPGFFNGVFLVVETMLVGENTTVGRLGYHLMLWLAGPPLASVQNIIKLQSA
jgi:hypothetical protein